MQSHTPQEARWTLSQRRRRADLLGSSCQSVCSSKLINTQMRNLLNITAFELIYTRQICMVRSCNSFRYTIVYLPAPSLKDQIQVDGGFKLGYTAATQVLFRCTSVGFNSARGSVLDTYPHFDYAILTIYRSGGYILRINFKESQMIAPVATRLGLEPRAQWLTATRSTD